MGKRDGKICKTFSKKGQAGLSAIAQIICMMTLDGHYEKDTSALERGVIEAGEQKTGLMAALMAAIKARIPAGYEDEDGFHIESKPRVHE
jgi:hypothetical protein